MRKRSGENKNAFVNVGKNTVLSVRKNVASMWQPVVWGAVSPKLHVADCAAVDTGYWISFVIT